MSSDESTDTQHSSSSSVEALAEQIEHVVNVTEHEEPQIVNKAVVDARLLHQASLESKRDRILTYDLGGGLDENAAKAKKNGILKWLNQNLPSKVKRSDKIGKIIVISAKRTAEQLEYLTHPIPRESRALAEWESMLESKDEITISYDTFKVLANKHNVKGGKWIVHIKSQNVDLMWKKVAWALGYDKFPKSVLRVGVTPKENSETVSSKDQGLHVISVWNMDYTDEETVLASEKALRSVGIRLPMIYKPDIFSAVGIYRNNEWKLRPAIYSSKFDKETREGVLESGLDLDWNFKVGAKK